MKPIRLLLLASAICLAIYYFYPEPALPSGQKVDSIVVYKEKRELLAYSSGQLLKTYHISLGKNPVGDKQYEGDSKTPEGIYTINAKNANSGYHKNLGVSYPSEEDLASAAELGKPAGGDIKIHGIRNGLGFIGKCQRWHDWTAGCMSLTNAEIDELFEAVEIGAKIEIKP